MQRSRSSSMSVKPPPLDVNLDQDRGEGCKMQASLFSQTPMLSEVRVVVLMIATPAFARTVPIVYLQPSQEIGIIVT